MAHSTNQTGSEDAPHSDGGRPRYRFGFDIGGTFTDFVLIDSESGHTESYKTLTTPDDPSRAVLEGWGALMDRSGASGSEVDTAIHGTTLITNALIERKGATTAMITTQGFRDVLEMGKEMRYDIYDLLMVLPEPLVARPLRLEVGERIGARGEVVPSIPRISKRFGPRSRRRAPKPSPCATCMPSPTPNTRKPRVSGSKRTSRISPSRCRARWRRRSANTSG